MAQRRHHYEQAFEHFLRARRLPYVAVDEARKTLLPAGAMRTDLKSFDFIVYARDPNLLVEVKGRRIRRVTSPTRTPRLENWVTREDVESLASWESLFGPDYQSIFVFAYWCDEQPPDALFSEIFEHRGRWYMLRSVFVSTYAAHMTMRSERWGTVHCPRRRFDEIAHPFAPSIGGTTGLDPPAIDPYGQ